MPFLAAALILSIWFVSAVLFIGFGLAFLGALQSPPRLSDAFWTGLAAWVAWLEVWHLILPITFTANLVPITAGLAGLYLARKPFAYEIRETLKIGRGPVLFYALLAAFLAFCSTGLSTHYDTGFYGAPAVRWDQAYPAVPGLANLHGRLGFDSAVMLCTAAFGPARYPELGFHVFTGLIICATTAWILPAWVKAWRKGRLTPSEWFLVTLSIVVADWILRRKVVSTETDLPASAAALMGVCIMIEHLTDPLAASGPSGAIQTPAAPGRSASRLIVVAAVCGLAVAIKLSTVVVAGGTWAAGLIWIFHSRNADVSNRRFRLWLAYFLIPVFLIAPYVLCNIITSGYPFYPSTFAPFHVDWLVPAEIAHKDADLIWSIARKPLVHPEDLRGWSWLGGWIVRDVLSGSQNAFGACPLIVPLVISMSTVICLWMFHKRRTARRSGPGPWVWMLVPTSCGLVFWFFTAPDPRFGEGAIWSITGILVAWMMSCVDLSKRPALSRVAAIVLIELVIVGPWTRLPDEVGDIIISGPRVGLIPLPHFPITARFTRSGLRVYQPEPPTMGAWAGPLPNAPGVNPDLILRDPYDMGKGFRLVIAPPPSAPTTSPTASSEPVVQMP